MEIRSVFHPIWGVVARPRGGPRENYRRFDGAAAVAMMVGMRRLTMSRADGPVARIDASDGPPTDSHTSPQFGARSHDAPEATP
jgi:hypothetical protein